MRKFIVAVLAVLGVVPAAYADGPKNWTGFYVGAHGGYDMGNIAISAGPFGLDGLSANGFAYGVHTGADYQLAGTPIVVGVGADYNFSDAKFKVTPGILEAGISQSWAVTARVGYAMGNALPYLLAGYTEAKAKASSDVFAMSASETLKGWQYGGGIELSLGPNVSAGVEYRYTRFDSVDLGGFAKLEPENHSVMGRLNLRLQPAETVAAALK